MAPDINLRPATPSDVPEMLTVFLSAFQDSLLNAHCFPDSDPASMDAHRSLIEKKLSEIRVAEDVPSGRILGWVCWVRKPTPSPPVTMTCDMYPASGDQDLARRFFQRNVDVTTAFVGDQAHWFLSLIVVRREERGKGVGAAMMQYGVERADDEGWMAYVNSSEDGKPLYEKFGFRTVEMSEFEHGLATWHMKREAKGSKN